jgi:putative pyruvate formate lyase activating enzyme
VDFVPSYIALHRSGELRRRADALDLLLRSCTVCPLVCGVNRIADERARCYTGYLPVVSSWTLHFGEEPALGGTRGVGNIFFGNCNLRCVYCQNHAISQNHHEERVREKTFEHLAEIMLELQEAGAHAIGLVSPSHVVPGIVRALTIAVERGLRLPLIYNSNAYDAVEVLRLLDGIIDIYLPDLKYAEGDLGLQYSKVEEYPVHARNAIVEMHRQVGPVLTTDGDGLVRRGLVIRHLVLPNDLAGSRSSLEWISNTLGPDVTVSVMAQYYPTHRAATTPLLDRQIRESEYFRVLDVLDGLGMRNGWIQEPGAAETYRPEFEDRVDPFGNEELRVKSEERREKSN